MQPDSSNILNQFCCENRVVLFLNSVVLSVIALSLNELSFLKWKVLLHAPVVGMFVMEMGWYALLLIESTTLKKTWSPRYTYIHSGVHIGLSILSFQIRPQGEG